MSLNVLLLGCGRIAHAHAEAISACSGVRLSTVCDIDVAAAQGLGAKYDVAAYTDASEALRKTTPEIVVICTPPATHRALTIDCLQTGAHVLCEKPLGLNPQEVTAMNDAAQSAGRTLMMASKFRFMPAARALKQRITAGELGEILYFRVTFFAPVAMQGRMNADPVISGGGVVMDNGPHAFDLARCLLGPVT
ncbi:MAG TPA: Gfo/Idh/MocA family oxidoreductase, partial [Abditibacteriaceae bacterium]